MWPEQPFENQLKKSLLKHKLFDKEIGEAFFDHYKQARNYLIENVYHLIAAREPGLTDHSEKHIRDVMKNAHLLLKDSYSSIDGMDLYLLGMCILIHDAGNIYNRKIHAEFDTITKVYDELFPQSSANSNERRVVASVAAAHSGSAKDGSRDTLKDLSESGNLSGFPVQFREMAALLRFADELAEGPQRTSQFMQDKGLYKPESNIYHKYASSTNIHIDRPLQRIALTYDIHIDFTTQKIPIKLERDLREQLTFTYHRIQKLNQERNYARHYSKYCTDFKRTTVAINIIENGRAALTLSDCVLEDRVIPGETKYESFESQFTSYSIDNVIKQLKQNRK